MQVPVEIHDPGIGEHTEVVAQPAFAFIVAILATAEKVGNGIGHGIFYEPRARLLAASVVPVAGARDHLDRCMVELQKSLPRDLPWEVVPGRLELGQQVERRGRKGRGHGGDKLRTKVLKLGNTHDIKMQGITEERAWRGLWFGIRYPGLAKFLENLADF
jgi:hypothetical protein